MSMPEVMCKVGLLLLHELLCCHAEVMFKLGLPALLLADAG